MLGTFSYNILPSRIMIMAGEFPAMTEIFVIGQIHNSLLIMTSTCKWPEGLWLAIRKWMEGPWRIWANWDIKNIQNVNNGKIHYCNYNFPALSHSPGYARKRSIITAMRMTSRISSLPHRPSFPSTQKFNCILNVLNKNNYKDVWWKSTLL